MLIFCQGSLSKQESVSLASSYFYASLDKPENMLSYKNYIGKNPLQKYEQLIIPVPLRVIKICESASHASQGVSHASRASHASHASHSINVKNFYLMYSHSLKNKNKSIRTR